MQQFWQIGRQIGYYVVAMQQDPKKAKIKKPTDLFKLSIDNPKKENKPIKRAVIKKANV